MQRILNSTASSTPPTAPTSGTPGHFTSGTIGSVEATTVDAWWLDQVQEELLAFLTAADITPAAGTNNQVLSAVQSLIATAITGSVTAAPSGSILWHGGPLAPTGYVKADGSALSRTAYPALFSALTGTVTGSLTNGNNVLTYTAASITPEVGWYVSGSGLGGGAITIASIGSGTLTLSANATSSEASGTSFVMSPYPLGDGSTTFNVPDLRGQFLRGVDNGRGVDPSRSLGTTQSSAIESHAITINDPEHTHAIVANGFDAAAGGTLIGEVPGSTALGNVTSSATGITAEYTGASETRPTNVALLACIKT